MRELSLFSGIGMGVYGTGLDVVAYCEISEFRRSVLKARMLDGNLPKARIFEDIKKLDASCIKCDIVTGGFPCQAFSKAAHGNNNAENLWPEMLRVILQCKANHVFAENVTQESIERASLDLEESDYTVSATRIDASAFGAPHKRTRWWLVAHSNKNSKPKCPIDEKASELFEVAESSFWKASTWPLRMANGNSSRLEQLAALGDGQVPVVARAALAYLW